jgi:predicted peptidase
VGTELPLTLDGDKSLSESADKSAHSEGGAASPRWVPLCSSVVRNICPGVAGPARACLAGVNLEQTPPMHTRFVAAVIALVLSSAPAFSGADVPDDTMQKPQQFKRQITRTLSADYLLFLPKGYDANGKQRWPLMLFLHGAGERGGDVKKVTAHGPPKIVKSKPEFPFILISPQCPEGETWSDDVLLGLLDEVIAKYNVDTNRVYLTGLSMGGYGTWSLGLGHPERFAAIAPICGGGETIKVMLASRKNAAALKSLGVWAFHGAKDQVVKIEESERMVAALKKAGVKEVELTVYPEAQHDSWTETYANEKLYEWFLKHERK